MDFHRQKPPETIWIRLLYQRKRGKKRRTPARKSRGGNKGLHTKKAWRRLEGGLTISRGGGKKR